MKSRSNDYSEPRAADAALRGRLKKFARVLTQSTGVADIPIVCVQYPAYGWLLKDSPAPEKENTCARDPRDSYHLDQIGIRLREWILAFTTGRPAYL